MPEAFSEIPLPLPSVASLPRLTVETFLLAAAFPGRAAGRRPTAFDGCHASGLPTRKERDAAEPGLNPLTGSERFGNIKHLSSPLDAENLERFRLLRGKRSEVRSQRQVSNF